MTTQFTYYEDWKTRLLDCPECGWRGRFGQGSVGYHEEVMDSSCRDCHKMLAIVAYPTLAETEANLDTLTAQEKRDLSARKTFLTEWEAASLKSPNQLPDVEEEVPFTLAWDLIGREGGREQLYTVLRHGEREIWREPACWEGYERFGEIVKILQTKYGYRLLDVIPTEASKLYLYGDVLRAIEIVEDIRKSFSRLRAIRNNLAIGWVFGQQMEQEAREEQEARNAAYLKSREPPVPTPRRRVRKKRPR